MSLSHHGESPEEQKKVMERFMAQIEGTARREYPAGRMGNEDDGELAFAITTDHAHKTVVIRFGKPVEWIGFGPKEAIALAQKLIACAREISTEPIGLTL